jgi:hypothetical protein
MIFDDTMMGSKIVFLIYFLIFFHKNKNFINLKILKIRKQFKNIHIAFLFTLLLVLSIFQIYIGENIPRGLFDTLRLSSLVWDQNYFAVLVITFYLLYNPPFKYPFIIIILTQSLANTVAIILYKFTKRFNLFIFLILCLSVFILPILVNNNIIIFDNIDNDWIRDRIFSYNMRASWVSDYINGSSLDDIAPHISFMSGLKKNVPFTILYFLLIFLYSSNRSIMWLILVISMSTDVILGPICFFIPFLLSLPYQNNLQLNKHD